MNVVDVENTVALGARSGTGSDIVVDGLGRPGCTLRVGYLASLNTVAIESDESFSVVTSSSPFMTRLPVPQVGYLLVYDTACSLGLNVPLSRSNRCTEGCATQPLLLSSP